MRSKLDLEDEMLGFAASDEGSLQYRFFMEVISLLDHQDECPALRLWSERRVHNLAAMIGVHSCGDTFKTDLLADGKSLILAGNCKRRRLDADLGRAIAGRAIAEGKAGTTGAFLRANVALGDGNERVLDMKWATSYQAAMHLSFNSAECVVVNWDGVRSGNPMVENILMFFGDVDAQRFGWGLPLETGRVKTYRVHRPFVSSI